MDTDENPNRATIGFQRKTNLPSTQCKPEQKPNQINQYKRTHLLLNFKKPGN